MNNDKTITNSESGYDSYLSSGGCKCPFCGSKDITGESIDIDTGSATQPVYCSECHGEWVDGYTLTSVLPIKNGNPMAKNIYKAETAEGDVINTLTLLTKAGLHEKAGLHKTFWGKRIIACDNDGFTQEDVKLASGWTTCACGRLHDRIPRKATGAPLDDELALLGMQFHSAIRNDNANLAAVTLIAIEKRAAIVLAEAKAQLAVKK